MALSISGSLPEIIRNKQEVYEGDLVAYFKVIFKTAQNLRRPYHNFRHMLHVVWLCYQACLFYKEILTPRQKRNLLVAALFHDFNHPGMMGDDDLNIERAIRGLKKHIVLDDRGHYEDIALLMMMTEYPPKADGETISLSAQILRDADMGQSLAPAWIQQVIFGLAEEWGQKPIEVLQLQPKFLGSLKFHTDWGKQMFPQSAIDEKIRESQELIELLA